MNTPELRAYFFVNHVYMSEKQWGIQSVHALSELYRKTLSENQAAMLKDWQDNHKTVILLQGGNCDNLKYINKVISHACNKLDYPSSVFFEDEASLNGAITCVMAIVPVGLLTVQKDQIFFDRVTIEKMIAEDYANSKIYIEQWYVNLLKATIGVGNLA